MNDLTFLQQLFARFKAKSPKFFKVITTIMLILTIITGIPQLLTLLNITLPDGLAKSVLVKIVFYASALSALISSLTVDNPATNTILTKIDAGVKPADARAQVVVQDTKAV